MCKEINKPNIVLVMADQLTPFLMGAYGHKTVMTPNLDKLAREGVRFDSAYTPCPICAPARAAMMTGRYVSKIGAYDNASPFGCDEPTFAHFLGNTGYETILSGKMHFVGPDQLHGFQRRLNTDIYPASFEWTTSREERKEFGALHENPIAIDYVTAGIRQWSMQLDYDEETHFQALEYIRSRRMQVGGTMQKPPEKRDERPFFLCVSYTHPHEPFHVTKDMWDAYENLEIDIPDIPENLDDIYSDMDRWLNIFHGTARVDLKNKDNLYNMRRAYYALVTYIDTKVGEIIKTLEDTGLRENTIVIFTSDHGDMLGEKAMVQKRCFYEYSARIPLIMNFPDGFGKGKKISGHVSLIDLAPTILEMAGIIEDDTLSMEGVSLFPYIKGEEAEDRCIFSELHTEGVYTTCFMAREGQYKYILITGKDGQLFNMENDPEEMHNLSGSPSYSATEEKLRNKILSVFDPELIEQNVRESLEKRKIIRKSMKNSKTSWDYRPFYDAADKYWREG